MDIGEIFNVIDQMMEDHIIPNIIRRMDILCQRYKFSLGINQFFRYLQILKMIALDMDGTLLNSQKKISKATLE